jgi:MFS family permease
LGAFFYGYLVSQIPGGLLAERYGAKWVLTGFLGLSTVATLLTPVAARTNFVLLIILRVLCGIGSVSIKYECSANYCMKLHLFYLFSLKTILTPSIRDNTVQKILRNKIFRMVLTGTKAHRTDRCFI